MDKITSLYYSHVNLGALMQPFAGYSMPIQYTGIIDEHKAVRERVGMFDVSHMGEFFISGSDAENFVNYIFSNNVKDMPEGNVLYGMMLNDNGGVVDDLLVYRLWDGRGFLMVVNAANIDKDFAWVESHLDGFDVKAENMSDAWSEIALQGPDAEKTLKNLLGIDMADLQFYTYRDERWNGSDLIISRTGYTGEDGFEIYGGHDVICRIWKIFLEAGVTPCGLGCRDTLRFEAGLPLYGHELSDDITPLEAGLGMFVKTDKENDFVGKSAILRQKETGISRKIVGLELKDKSIPRAGYSVTYDGKPVGYVTTGYRSISLEKSICMAMVPKELSAIGTELSVQVRSKSFAGTVCKKRFYEAKYKK